MVRRMMTTTMSPRSRFMGQFRGKKGICIMNRPSFTNGMDGRVNIFSWAECSLFFSLV